jgi:hypothetical protein
MESKFFKMLGIIRNLKLCTPVETALPNLRIYYDLPTNIYTYSGLALSTITKRRNEKKLIKRR